MEKDKEYYLKEKGRLQDSKKRVSVKEKANFGQIVSIFLGIGIAVGSIFLLVDVSVAFGIILLIAGIALTLYGLYSLVMVRYKNRISEEIIDEINDQISEIDKKIDELETLEKRRETPIKKEEEGSVKVAENLVTKKLEPSPKTANVEVSAKKSTSNLKKDDLEIYDYRDVITKRIAEIAGEEQAKEEKKVVYSFLLREKNKVIKKHDGRSLLRNDYGIHGLVLCGINKFLYKGVVYEIHVKSLWLPGEEQQEVPARRLATLVVTINGEEHAVLFKIYKDQGPYVSIWGEVVSLIEHIEESAYCGFANVKNPKAYAATNAMDENGNWLSAKHKDVEPLIVFETNYDDVEGNAILEKKIDEQEIGEITYSNVTVCVGDKLYTNYYRNSFYDGFFQGHTFDDAERIFNTINYLELARNRIGIVGENIYRYKNEIYEIKIREVISPFNYKEKTHFVYFVIFTVNGEEHVFADGYYSDYYCGAFLFDERVYQEMFQSFIEGKYLYSIIRGYDDEEILQLFKKKYVPYEKEPVKDLTKYKERYSKSGQSKKTSPKKDTGKAEEVSPKAVIENDKEEQETIVQTAPKKTKKKAEPKKSKKANETDRDIGGIELDLDGLREVMEEKNFMHFEQIVEEYGDLFHNQIDGVCDELIKEFLSIDEELIDIIQIIYLFIFGVTLRITEQASDFYNYVSKKYKFRGGTLEVRPSDFCYGILQIMDRVQETLLNAYSQLLVADMFYRNDDEVRLSNIFGRIMYCAARQNTSDIEGIDSSLVATLSAVCDLDIDRFEESI